MSSRPSRFRGHAGALAPALALAFGACQAPPPAPAPAGPGGAARAPFVAGRALVEALGDYFDAAHALRLYAERPDLAGDPGPLEERLGRARRQLVEAAREAGAPPDALAADDERLLRALHGAIEASGRYAVLFPDDPGSITVVRLREVHRDRAVRLFGEPWRYTVVLHDETLVEDYPAYRARRLGGAPLLRPATYAPAPPPPAGAAGAARAAGAEEVPALGTVWVDLAAARAIGERQFLPTVAALRQAAAAAERDAPFLERAAPERLAELLGLARAALRWRSLEPLWSHVQARPQDEQLRRFVEDYAARAELRAAAELRERLRVLPGPPHAGPGAGPGAGPDADRAALALELGALSALVHGEPLGALADQLALAAASLGAPEDSPTFVAARRVVVELARALRGPAGSPPADGGPPTDEAAVDARAFAALARLRPDALREAARALHARRVAALDPPSGDGAGGRAGD